MTDIQKVPPIEGQARPETGPMQFGDDWPGVFIRGDNALFFAVAVLAAAEALPDDMWLLKSQLKGLASDLRSCKVGETGWPP